LALVSAGLQYHAAENTEETKPNPRELVLFAGIGGCSMGDEEAGFNCKWLVDKDHLAAASLRQCHPNAIIYDEDVGAFLDKCKAQRPGYPTRDDVDHVQVSSPCNGFSRMNIYGGRHDHKNNILCHELVRATEIFLPKTGMFENVTGMLDASHVHHIIKILQGLIRLKYQVRIAVLNSIDFGVPQKRKRVILTLARDDIPMPRMPSPTRGEDSFTTIGDAIHDMNGVECEMERHRSGLVQLPNGVLTFNHVARVARKDSKTLDLDESVATITTQNSFRHPLTRTNRTLSIREYARLFGLPDSVQLFGSYTVIRKHIGNSVPVPLARAISIPIRRVHDEQCSKSSCTGTEE
jgi:DNA (cytosine-5)-methyltransferase 1